MNEQPRAILYLTPDARRFFLVPADDELPTGDYTVATLDGHERLVSARAIRRFQVSQEHARRYFRAVAESAIAALGATEPDAEEASSTARTSTLERYAGEVREVAARLSGGDPETLRNARETLSRHGLELGETLDELKRYLRATRQLEEPAMLGRRVDASIQRLERTVGPLTGLEGPRRQEQQAAYERSARSAIAEALRAADITPLGSAHNAD